MAEPERSGIRAVALDLDDTILAWQTVAHWQWAWKPNGPVLPERRVRSVLRRAEHRWDRARWHALAEPSTPSAPPSYEAFLASTLQEIAGHPLPDDEVKAVVRRFLSAVGGVEPFADVRPFIDRVTAEGLAYRIATILPKAPAESVLHRFGLPPDRLVVWGDDTEVPAIPNRAAFRAIASRLELPARAILYVGDLFWSDYRAAGRAGMESIWLDRQGIGERTGAQRVRDLASVPSFARPAPTGDGVVGPTTTPPLTSPPDSERP